MWFFFIKKSTAKVQLSCEDGKLFVNLCHDLGVVEEITPEPESSKPLYNNVLEKNLRNSQFVRLQKRANAWAEDAILETKVQQEIAANENIDRENATKDTKKARVEAENAKSFPLKQKLEAQQDIEHLKLVSEKAHQESLHSREKAEKAKALANRDAEKAELELLKVKDVNHIEAEQAGKNFSVIIVVNILRI